eukprot:TRINITY_DN6419_c0_g1_i1.p1 TRINITY_DN6419_c0_g1~~TRINITY_DN6419_c0_g1_i1.p1  ORF type:complete len:625 (-),score=203.25 TRINITY_DN6419_c0_g1_i1:138-2012(-)
MATNTAINDKKPFSFITVNPNVPNKILSGEQFTNNIDVYRSGRILHVTIEEPLKPPVFYMHIAIAGLKRSDSAIVTATGIKTKQTILDVADLISHASYTKVEGVCETTNSDSDKVVYNFSVSKTKAVKWYYRYSQNFFTSNSSSPSSLVETRSQVMFKNIYEKIVTKQIENKIIEKQPLTFDIHTSLGNFSIFVLAGYEEILHEFFQTLPLHTLCMLATVSRAMRFFIEDDKYVWRPLAKKMFKCNIKFKNTWRRSILEYFKHPKLLKEPEFYYPQNLQSDSTTNFNSKWFYCGKLEPFVKKIPFVDCPRINSFLYRKIREWVITHIDMAEFNSNFEHLERIHVNSLDYEKFVSEYDALRMPFLLCGAMDTWPAYRDKKWFPNQFVANYGEKIFRAGPGCRMTGENYFEYMKAGAGIDERPSYLFDDEFDEKDKNLLEDYSVPKIFEHDFFELLTGSRPAYRWIVIGPSRSTTSFHFDLWHTSAWNALITGRKRWFLFPPGVHPPGLFDWENEFNDDYGTPEPIRWMIDYYSFIIPKLKPIECIQQPGEIIYVPSGWWHMVINLDDTIAVTQNIANEQNLEDVARDIAENTRKWGRKLKKRILKKRSDLFENGVLEKRFCGSDL